MNIPDTETYRYRRYFDNSVFRPCHIMLDLETFGTTVGSSILSVGAVAFTVLIDGSAQVTGEFYSVVSRKSCRAIGLVEDPGTLDWWQRQDEKARTVLRQCEMLVADTALPTVLSEFATFVTAMGSSTSPATVWGNGADFDNALLQHAASRCGLPPLWGHRQNRCYRTLKTLIPDFFEDKLTLPQPVEPEGHIAHHAVHDARVQADHLAAILHEFRSSMI